MRWQWLLGLLLLLMTADHACAGIFGNKKPKGNEAERVAELLGALKDNPSATKRTEAAEELRNFDGKEFPEVVPALIDALQKDSSSSVRAQSAESLGKLKPASHEAAQALDHAVEQDKSFMVRFKARTARLGYRVPQEKTPPGTTPIKVPPPDENGRLKPVPLPPTDDGMATKPLPPPDEKDHVTLKPKVVGDGKNAPAEETALPKLGLPKKNQPRAGDELEFLEGPRRN